MKYSYLSYAALHVAVYCQDHAQQSCNVCPSLFYSFNLVRECSAVETTLRATLQVTSRATKLQHACVHPYCYSFTLLRECLVRCCAQQFWDGHTVQLKLCAMFRPCYTRQFFLQQTLHCKLQARFHNTPFLQSGMQQNVALRVERKVELSSTFRTVVRQVAACVMSIVTCNAILWKWVIQRASFAPCKRFQDGGRRHSWSFPVGTLQSCEEMLWHPLCNLKCFHYVFVIVATQVARKIAPCDMAFWCTATLHRVLWPGPELTTSGEISQ